MEVAPGPSRMLLPIALVVLALQAWIVFRIESRSTDAPPADVAPATSVGLSASSNQADAIAAALTRMDARLAALELQAARSDDGATRPAQASAIDEVLVGSPAALAADKVIARLLPSGNLTQEELQQVYVAIGQQPAEQRGALMAAMSRAINDGRVRIRP
ncbi:hypothetical protein [Arenimonas sp.]|uniref:hypothetical protein n=1 Tax=Arenimonas sp. TaxID=1872635 RepID=UPI0039E3A44A